MLPARGEVASIMERKQPERSATACPSCGHAGSPVKLRTLESLVAEAARDRIRASDGFRFCAEPSCDVVYYHPERGELFPRSEVLVRVGLKESEAPRLLCYCFGHTVEEVEAEVRATGTSGIADAIASKCRQGLHRCEETNPRGSCCLGEVRRAIQTAAANASRRPRALGSWASAGAVVAAVLSSVCCWLPLLLLAFGVSAAGVGSAFEAYRPVFLGGAAVLISWAFYLAYFRRQECGPGASCAASGRSRRSLSRFMLWISAALVLAFTLFPSLAGNLFGRTRGPAATRASSLDPAQPFEIEGTSCEACADTPSARQE